MDWLLNSWTAVAVVLVLVGMVYLSRRRHGTHGVHEGHCCGDGRHEHAGDAETAAPRSRKVSPTGHQKSHCH